LNNFRKNLFITFGTVSALIARKIQVFIAFQSGITVLEARPKV